MGRVIERTLGLAACAAAVLLLVVALLLGARVQASGPARLSAVSVRLATVAGRPAAGYFTLDGGSQDDTLTGVASPLATRIELHSSSMAGGVMRMDTLPAVRIAAGGRVVFAPGGNHLMVFGLAPPVRPGATVPLVFRFRSGATLRAEAMTVAPGAAVAAHGAH